MKTRVSSKGQIVLPALTNHLTVVTRNVSDFEKAGCDVVDPFEA